MTELSDFTDGDSSESDPAPPPGEKPQVERLHPIESEDGDTLYGYVGRDHHREGVYVYSSPRTSADNYYRKVGGFPISEWVVDRLRQPPANASWDPAKLVYIIVEDGLDPVLPGVEAEMPPMTVLEYTTRAYAEGAYLNHEPFGEQRCPTINDARRIWPGLGGAMFLTGKL